MTFTQYAENHLHTCGMFPKSIQEIVEQFPKHKLMEPLRDQLNKNIEGLPKAIVGMFIMQVNKIALEYVDEHIPEAWYRPMLLPAKERKAFLEKSDAEHANDFLEKKT